MLFLTTLPRIFRCDDMPSLLAPRKQWKITLTFISAQRRKYPLYLNAQVSEIEIEYPMPSNPYFLRFKVTITSSIRSQVSTDNAILAQLIPVFETLSSHFSTKTLLSQCRTHRYRKTR